MIIALIAITSIGVLTAIYSLVVDSKRSNKSSQEKAKDLLSPDKVNPLQEQLNHFKEKSLESESLFDELQDKLTNAKSEQDNLVAQIEQQKDELTTELNQIKTANTQTQNGIKKAEQQAAELKEELYKENKESQKLREKIGRSNEVAEMLSNQIKTADSQTQNGIKKAEQQAAELKEELSKERKENQKLKEKIDESNNVTERLSEEIKKLIEKSELLQKQVNELIEEKNEHAKKEQSKSFDDAQTQKKNSQEQIEKENETKSKRESLSEKNQSLSSETEKIKDYKEASEQQNHYSEYLIKKDILHQKDDLPSQTNLVSGNEVRETDKKQLEKSIQNRRIKTKKIGRICVKHGLITSKVLDDALKRHEEFKVSLIQYLISRGHLGETDLAQCLSSQSGVPFLSMERCEISADIIKYVPYEIAEKYQLLPIDKVGDMLSVIMIDPTDIEAIRAVVSSSHCNVNVFVGLTSEIIKAIKYNYSSTNYSSTIEALKKEYQGPENRKSQRFKTDASMKYFWNNIYVESKVKNVSLHGMAFECKDKLPINKKIKLQIFLPDSIYDDPLEIRAKVTRTKKLEGGNFEIGLEFTHISELSLNYFGISGRIPFKKAKPTL